MAEGYLSEIFTSIQGEGAHVGSRQIFIRFSGCSLRCDFCDTKNSWERTEQFIIDTPEKYDLERTYTNPVDVEDTVGIIQKIIKKEPNYHSIFLTGGEPLEQPEYLRDLVSELKKSGLKLYLETNTVNYESIESIAEQIDIISADVKILHPDFGKKLLNSLLKFLSLPTLSEFFLKIPVNSSLDFSLFAETIKKISSIRIVIPIIIQPLTEELLPEPDKKFIDKLFYLQSFTLNYFRDVRVIPQIHKFMKIK